ncbi:hypothetical protein ASF53_06760 [Methylobacterium sp. Leaf123]|uniref:hypothetical protein n=1 Tax=Methylobacterium sp. Leaf123 TaxID=1736264 RepID=UPI0006F3A589|nr:hypothetical protein [Methylobacterium sp. Leaf123]KQQ18060.1 hypothetical protein ASF53_06760 [Methylobacterium sp. Leaf123]
MTTIETHSAHSGPMNPAGMPAASFETWQALVAPGDVFRHPREVLAHPLLSRADKRAILASWPSDACALENAPALRCLPGCKAEPVPVDIVLAALGTLDRGPPPAGTPASGCPALPRRPRRLLNRHRFPRFGRRNDDDDPPPCPAAVMPRPRTPPSAAALAVAIPA